jgi:hypothetical protein
MLTSRYVVLLAYSPTTILMAWLIHFYIPPHGADQLVTNIGWSVIAVAVTVWLAGLLVLLRTTR